MDRLSYLIDALTILDKYSDPDKPCEWSVYCDSLCDGPTVADDGSPVSAEDADKLRSLGWRVDETLECWAKSW